MLNRVKTLLAPPVFEDEEKSRTAGVLNFLLLSFIGLFFTFNLLWFLMKGRLTTLNLVLLLVIVGLFVMLRRGWVKIPSLIFAFSVWGLLSLQAWNFGGVRDSSFFACIVAILFANVLLGWRWGAVITVLGILSGWVLAYGEATGLIQTQIDSVYDIALEATILFAMVAVVLGMTTASLKAALRRARHNEQELTKRNRELQVMQASLEDRVQSRTNRLETVAMLGERFSAILDFNQLLNELVNQVKESFGYYHTHVYVIDEEGQNLVVAAGTGTAGAQMKAERHSIPLDAPTSLVAQAARYGEIVRVDDVRRAKDWLPNPLLPDTYSEMAVPIMLEGEVVGVLDVQEDKVGGLDEGDASLLRSLASQVAVAIRNARLFGEVETALARAHAAQEQYLEQAWQKSRSGQSHNQYLYARPAAEAVDENRQQAMAAARQQALRQERPAVIKLDGDQARTQSLVAPISLRNTAIGTLQLHASDEDSPWTEDDLTVIEAVLEQLAQTAENLRLFDQTRTRAGREQIIREITERMRTANNLDDLLKITAQALGQQLSAGHAVIELGMGPEPDQPGNGRET